MNANKPLATPLEKLNARVKSIWQRSQMLHFADGLLAFCHWGIVLFLVAMLLDWLIDLPSPFRIALLAIILGITLYQAWKNGWRNVRRFNAARAALQIEEYHGDLESLLVTAVQFSESKMAPGTSRTLQEVTCRRAEESITDLETQKVVIFSGLRRPLTIGLILAALIVAFSIYNGPFLAAGIARIFPPWSAVAYPTRTQLELDPQKIIVKEGSPTVIKARVLGVIPDNAKLALRTGNGEPRIHELKISDDHHCEYTIKSAYRSFEYRITAGDAKSPWQEVQVISSPRIEQANVELQYPDYTKRPTEIVEALTVTVPEGTNIQWQLTLDRAVSKATYTPTGGNPKTLSISPDGLTVTMQAPATESRAYSFSWVEKDHGFSFTSPNHYLQVAPDVAPRAELTSPKKNLYATLGRNLDLVFRGRDDHGISTTHIAYRVNKIAEQKIAITSPDTKDGGAQKIDWDYRKTLPDLAIGDTVSFVVELTDSYPGAEGPHVARSQARRITFLSERDYLKQIFMQRQRLLRKLRALYREERKVHSTVSKLDPSAPEFIQSCQLEAVRQDLMRERIGTLKLGIKDLLDDLKANNISNENVSGILIKLHSDLQRIADEHVGLAATNLRKLAAAVQKDPKSEAAISAVAIHSVDSAARELGCLVLQIGFREATEVMARELHAIAENQAPMRLQTILLEESSGSHAESLANSQEQLSQWVTRLFSSLPQDKESTIEDALVAFNLSRLIKELRLAGVEPNMLEAATSIRQAGGNKKAAALQAQVIESLLYAEFRLRIGSEHEALDKANELFITQATSQKKLRETISSLTPEQFKQSRDELTRSQANLQKQLHLLLIPAIPARRPSLFDTKLPPKPPVENLLSTAENAMKQATAHITSGDQQQAATEQQKAEASFDALSEIIRLRISRLTERAQFAGLSMGMGKHTTAITEFEERQLNLLEKTEDAENDKEAVHLARLQEKLAQDIAKFKYRVDKFNKEQTEPSDDIPPLISHLTQLEASMNKSTTALKSKNIDGSIEHQESTLEMIEKITKLLADQSLQTSHMAMALNDTWTALRPAPYVIDIQEEQVDLVKATAKAKENELPQLAIVQKNLIHAVNAVLEALDPLSHQVESGTVFLFAKEDMDAAATAIEDNDLEEAADAGSFVAESLEKLSKELATVTPRYSYMLEITEFYHHILKQNGLLRMQQNQLRNQLSTVKDDAAVKALAAQQGTLQSQAESYSHKLLQTTGQTNNSTSSKHMTTVLEQLNAGDKDAAAETMELAESTLAEENEQMTLLMELLVNVLKPSPTPEVTPESALVLDLISLASDQKVLFWQTQATDAKSGKELTAQQRKLAQRCEAMIKRTAAFAQARITTESGILPAGQGGANVDPAQLQEALAAQKDKTRQFFATYQTHLILASKLSANAATKLESGNTKDANNQQHQAGEQLRYVIIAYIDALLSPPAPPSSDDPVQTDPTDPPLEDSLTMYMPGAISGAKPKGGRQEWEVLGKRDRAALNENFARELPLEYRAVLKDYYERLAE